MFAAFSRTKVLIFLESNAIIPQKIESRGGKSLNHPEKYHVKQIVFAKYTLFRLKTQTVLAGRLAKMLGAVATEIGKSCEIHKFCYLGEGQAFIIQIVL